MQSMLFIALIDPKTAIYGCSATKYEKKPHFNIVFTVSFISLMVVISSDKLRAFVTFPPPSVGFKKLESSALELVMI